MTITVVNRKKPQYEEEPKETAGHNIPDNSHHIPRIVSDPSCVLRQHTIDLADMVLKHLGTSEEFLPGKIRELAWIPFDDHMELIKHYKPQA